MDLNKLGLFMDEDIFLIPDDATELLLANKFKNYGEDLPEETGIVSEPAPALSPTEVNSNNSQDNDIITLSYEGDFEKGLLIIYQGEEMSEDIKAFLLKILRAVSYSLKDIGLVSSVQLSSFPPTALNQLNAHKVIVFGRLSHPIIKLKEANYEITADGDTEYIFADDLPVIFEDENLKRKLWKSLQAFFNINK
ncbi:hypothetical protein [Echinicola arenosa]|nr:hypothetical protein [Echinicola arenosa]